MSAGSRVLVMSLTAVTIILALWAGLGWVNILVTGGSWSDKAAMSGFSVALIVLALVCAALWRSRARGMAIVFLGLAVLAALSLLASFVGAGALR